MFEASIEKFRRYRNGLNTGEPPHLDIANEVEKRLRQLDYLYKIIMEKHEKIMRLISKEYFFEQNLRKKLQMPGGTITIPKSEETYEKENLFFEVELLTESFYYIAGRMRTAIRKSKSLPGLETFECEGARNVRNKLLEHAEGKDSGVLTQSFGVGGEEGPTLKAARQKEQEEIFPDAGLESNALEIKNNLETLLDNVLIRTKAGY